MADAELRARAEQEQNRITAILNDAGISERRMQTLAPIIENVSWMRAKLDDSRQLIKNSNIVVPYDNGGGQKGIRENPAFRGYEALWKSYMQGMNRILDTLPEEEAKTLDYEDMKPQSVLSIVRDRHRSAV